MKYKVLKEFVDASGDFRLVGELISVGGELPRQQEVYFERLVCHDFIEEVKEDKRFIPKLGEKYYTINGGCNVYPLRRIEYLTLGDYYEKNMNMYRSRETAEKVAEALKLVFEYLHTTCERETILGNQKSMDLAIDDARRAVLVEDKSK